MDIHNYDRSYQTALAGLGKSEISTENKQLIRKFLTELELEGISKPRIIKYVYCLMVVARKLKKNFDTASVEDLKIFIGGIQQKTDYSYWTKIAYKTIVKRFYKWMSEASGYPDVVSWILVKRRRADKKLPSDGDLLTEDDIQKLLSVAENLRDKAFVAALWESGCRIGEIGNLCLKDVVFDKHGVVICVKGKTGARKIRLIFSTSYLSTWINSHSRKGDNTAPLWINIGHPNKNKAMRYNNLVRLLKVLFEKTDITKGFNPHLFRHSRATFLASHLTEFQMNQYFGWIQGSEMPSTYVHMSGKEVDSAILKLNGIQTVENKQKTKLKPIVCPRCDTINAPDSKHCNKCGGVTDLKHAMELEEKREEESKMRNDSDKMMTLLLKDKEVQALLREKLRRLSGSLSSVS